MRIQMGEKLIDQKQLLILLVVSRMASLTAFSPAAGAVEGTAVLLSQIPSLIIQLLLLLPAWWVVGRWGGSDLLDCMVSQNATLGKPVVLLCWLFCLYQTASGIFSQAQFQTTTLYPGDSPLPLIIALLVGVGYMVYLGLEGTARLSLWAFCLFAILIVAITLPTLHLINPLNLRSPLANGVGEVLWAAWRTALQSPELAAAVLLMPVVRGKAGRFSAIACGVWTLLLSAITFLILGVLGNFAATRPYPMYALSAVGGSPTSSHMEAFYTAAWVFLALIRAAMFLWLGMRCGSIMLGGTKHVFWINLLSAGAMSIIVFLYVSIPQTFMLGALSSGVVVLLLPVSALVLGKGFVKEDNRYGQS